MNLAELAVGAAALGLGKAVATLKPDGVADLVANLPAAADNTGKFYLVSGNGHAYFSNGSAWIDAGAFQGPTGAAGADSTVPGPKGATIIGGSTDPGVEGQDGDWYLNTTSHVLFGPKGLAGWGTGFSLVGPQGDQGVAGADGANGADGTSIIVKGSVNTPDDLPVSGNTDGDLYVMDTTGTGFDAGDGYVWGSSTWTNIGQIRGPQGAAGSDGAQGPAGNDGAAGADGKTVLNGTVDPTSEGTDGDFYLNTISSELFGPKTSGSWGTGVSLIGPQGIQGDQGIQGPAGNDGAQGAAGADGSNGAPGADGKSVLNGTFDPTTEGVDGDFYINTASSYIFGPKASGSWPTGVSLVGPQGAQGDTGATGSTGATGATGPAGSQVVVAASISGGGLTLDFGGENDVLFTLSLNAAITAGITFSNVPTGAARFTLLALSDNTNVIDGTDWPASVTLTDPAYTYTDGTMTIYWGETANGGTNWYVGNNGPVGGIADGDQLATGLTFPNTGLKILDTNASHALTIAPGSDLTAARTVTINTGDASRAVTINGDVTLPAGTALVSGGALGTPSGGTLTNCTGLPVAGIAASTSTALGVGSVEVGHASDTTLSRSAAGVLAVEGVNLGRVIASGTATLGTSAIASGASAAAVTVAATGVATTDVIDWGFNGDPTGVTGYIPSANGILTIIAYPTANNVNFKVVNLTAASITPGAITLNWKVVR